MSYPPDHKPRVHLEIVRAAARLFREVGIQATGIDRLMGEVGLTRGGFYAHFASKAALADEALAFIFAESRENLFAKGHERLSGAAWVRAATRRYLDPGHAELPGEGCAIPALGAEIARAEPSVRTSFQREVDAVVALIAERGGLTRAEASSLLAVWVGAVTMARSMGDARRAREHLDAARAHVEVAFVASLRSAAQVGPEAAARGARAGVDAAGLG